MFERMEMSESIYEGVVEPSYKKILGNMPTVLVSAGKSQEKLPCKLLTLRQVRALANAEKGM